MDKNYSADNIEALSFGEAIRRRPDLYFEKCFSEKTLDSLPFEVLCHAFDEYFDGSCKSIDLTIFNDSFEVRYDAGISLEEKTDGLTKAEIIMTRQFACKNEKKHLTVGEEFCSLGMATINYASEKCELITVCDEKKGHYIFEYGETISKYVEVINQEGNYTSILIKPSKSLFKDLHFTLEGINIKAKNINNKLTDLTINIYNRINE